MNPNGTALPLIDKIRTRAMLVGLAGAGLSIVGALTNRASFDRAYLFSFVFVLGLALGSMALLLLHRQLGGAWGFLVRRPLEASAMTLPLVAIFFIPVLIDLEYIYPWVNHPPGTEAHADPGAAEHNDHAAAPAESHVAKPTEGSPSAVTEVHPGDKPEAPGNPMFIGEKGKFPGSLGVRRDPLEVTTTDLFAFKKWWLTPANFTIRAGIYFFIWIVMAAILNIGSRRQDETRSVDLAYNLQSFSAPGIVVYFLTTSLALVDWGMSLEPDWYSSLYGVLLIIGQGLSAICLMIIMTAILARRGETDGLDTHETFNDLGNLMLAFTIALGLPQLLAVPDHLVGQPRRGNPLVRSSPFARLGERRPVLDGLPLLPPLHHFAGPPTQAEHRLVVEDRRSHALCPHGGRLLADHPIVLRGTAADCRQRELARHRGASRSDRSLVHLLPHHAPRQAVDGRARPRTSARPQASGRTLTMFHSTPQPPGPPPDPADGHERTDVAAKPILYFLIGLVVFGGVVQASMSFLMTGYVRESTQSAEAT